MSSAEEDSSPTASDGEDEGQGGHKHAELHGAQDTVREWSAEASPVSSEGSDDLYADEARQNRFPGTAKAWRSHTESERALIASLDCQRANDLSIHLYNTHALKRRARDGCAIAPFPPASREIDAVEKDVSKATLWCPDARWSAWPLDPCDVPRLNENFGRPIDGFVDSDIFGMVERWRPSDDLEAEVLATTLRIAKENFRTRQGHQNEEQRSNAADMMQTFVLNGVEGRNANPGDEIDLLPASAYDFIIDDEHIEDLLAPKFRQSLAGLDKLLQGLHSSRQITKANTARPWSKRPQPRSSDSESPQDRKISMSSRKPSISAESRTSAQGRLQHDQKSYKSKRLRTLKPRDWTEVLNVAAFVGWDADVLKRTTERCLGLFGEEHNFSAVLNPEYITERSEESASPSEASPNVQGVREVTKEPPIIFPTRGWSRCPHESCRRYSRPWDQPFRWREHMKRSHKYSHAQVKDLEQQLKQESILKR